LAALVSVAAISLLATLGLQSRRSAGWIRADNATAVAYRPWLDLNACDWPELCLVPGISETLARRIVDARRELGAFRDLNDLQRVPGIGPKKLRQLAAAAGVAETMPLLYRGEATRLGSLE
jgi:DNA uptake protein ComE-like DNA-binding protein